jgi:hypothetical protein
MHEPRTQQLQNYLKTSESVYHYSSTAHASRSCCTVYAHLPARHEAFTCPFLQCDLINCKVCDRSRLRAMQVPHDAAHDGVARCLVEPLVRLGCGLRKLCRWCSARRQQHLLKPGTVRSNPPRRRVLAKPAKKSPSFCLSMANLPSVYLLDDVHISGRTVC